MSREFPRLLCLLLVVACAGFGSTGAAMDFAYTGFGTLEYAVADKDLRYLRYIDEDGSFKADSLFGFQAEARFNQQWGATVQAVASAPRTRDSGYEAKIRWAFLSYRPNNEWLFRAGRLRPPVLFNTQNAEVGVTYDQARLPMEVYSLSPVYDVDGGAFTRTWALENAEVNLDGYWGKTKLKFRLPFQRNGMERYRENYFPEKVTLKGAVVSYSSGSLVLRGGAHQATLKSAASDEPFFDALSPTPFPAPAPFGGTLYGPGNVVDAIYVNVLTFGADWRWRDWRITGEYGQRIIDETKIAVESKSGYVTVARVIGKWTPYVTYARLLSGRDTRQHFQDVNSTPVPLGAQGPPLFLPADFHRNLADVIPVYDQYSVMLGTSYSFSANSKLKLEWMRTHVGLRSALVDGDVSDKSFNVFSIGYSFAF